MNLKKSIDEKININTIIKIKKVCKYLKKKFFLSNYVKLAIQLDLDGVYIPSFNKKININFYSKKKKFIILGSAHNIKEIRIKEKQNVSCIFLSSFINYPPLKVM